MSFIDYFRNATDIAKWATPNCIRAQLATDNGVRDRRYALGLPMPHLHGAAHRKQLLHRWTKHCIISACGRIQKLELLVNKSLRKHLTKKTKIFVW